MAHLLQEEAHTDVTSLRNERLVPKEIRGGGVAGEHDRKERSRES